MPNSQTRKKSNARKPKTLNDLEWLANPYEQLKRSLSFSGKGVSDEEFFRFFEEVGEVAENRSPRTPKRNTRKSPKRAAGEASPSPKSAKSPKGKAAKSPKATGTKSPKVGTKAGTH